MIKDTKCWSVRLGGIMTAERSQRDTIRRAILEVLEERGEDVSLPELLEALSHKGLAKDMTGDEAIKMAIWPLMSDALLDLTEHRKLRLVAHA